MGRDAYWDVVKFVLIISVVFGHALLEFSEYSRINMALYNTIYMFHMPCFIFISGRFSHIKDREKYKKGIFRLLETYIVFQIIRSVLENKPVESIVDWLLIPNYALWFLLSLIVWRLVVFFTPPTYLNSHKRLIICISVFLSIFSGFVPIGRVLSFQRIFAFLPFFILGYYSEGRDINSIIKRVGHVTSLLTLVGVFIFFCLVNVNFAFAHHCNLPYMDCDTKVVFLRLFGRVFYLPMAMIISIVILKLSSYIKGNKVFAKYGGKTMAIFIYHMFFIDMLIKNEDNLPHAAWFVALYSAITMLLLCYLSNRRIFIILLNPISKLNNNYGKKRNF